MRSEITMYPTEPQLIRMLLIFKIEHSYILHSLDLMV